MKIAVEGCCHGELDKIYETIAYLEQKDGVKVELLLCCGDFQSVRNKGDMHCMAVPDKYKQMQTFYKYYSGEKKAPILTIFIGGNHEASNYLQELPYGGWVAPNIYYLGYAGVVRFKGVRIAGVSGIFKSHDYRRGHFEFPPYNRDTLRSVYHTRNIDVFKLKQIKMPIDIFLSHDWPRGIHDYGDRPQLLRKKKFLRQDVESNSLGSPASAELLEELQPSYWFSAHLHVKFAAVMQHPPKAGAVARSTRFLSLDKCLPYRDFLQIVDLPDRPSSAQGLEYDPEWLAILKATDSLQNLTPQTWNPPQNNGLHARWDFSASEEAMMAAVGDLGGELAVPDNFSRTVAAYDPSQPGRRDAPSCSTNPQTTELCATLGLTDIYALVTQGGADPRRKPADEEEDEDAGSAGSGEEPSEYPTDTSGLSASYNPDEITIEDEWEEEEEAEDGKKGEGGGEGGSAGRSADAVVPEGGAGGRPENPCSPLRGLHPNRMVLPDPRSNRSPSLPLSLPPPCHSTPVHARAATHAPSPDPTLSPTPGLSGGEGDGPAVRVPKRTSGESADGAGTGSTPVIKRRNQTIYTAAEDEDGEG